jgi:hypothetical protein
MGHSTVMDIVTWFKKWAEPPHPTWQSKASRNRALQFLQNEQARSSDGLQLNFDSGSRRFGKKTLNLGLLAREEVDVQDNLLHLPMKDLSVDTIVCVLKRNHRKN